MIIHPAFVHFPIAFLVIYSLLELIPFHLFLFRNAPWRVIKQFLLYVGTLAVFPTIVTGFMAQTAVGETPVSELHEHFALFTMAIYLLASFTMLYQEKKGTSVITTYLLKMLALAGFVAVMIVGALGAAVAHGQYIDPIVTFVYSLFFK